MAKTYKVQSKVRTPLGALAFMTNGVIPNADLSLEELIELLGPDWIKAYMVRNWRYHEMASHVRRATAEDVQPKVLEFLRQQFGVEFETEGSTGDSYVVKEVDGQRPEIAIPEDPVEGLRELARFMGLKKGSEGQKTFLELPGALYEYPIQITRGRVAKAAAEWAKAHLGEPEQTRLRALASAVGVMVGESPDLDTALKVYEAVNGVPAYEEEDGE